MFGIVPIEQPFPVHFLLISDVLIVLLFRVSSALIDCLVTVVCSSGPGATVHLENAPAVESACPIDWPLEFIPPWLNGQREF